VNLRGVFEDKGQAVAQLVEALRCNPEVAGLIPDGVNRISH
jgi:hypothetical protein